MFKQTAPDGSLHDASLAVGAMADNGSRGDVRVNAPTAFLFAEALRRGEGVVAANGALRVLTGERTGRSPRDRFIVRESASAPHIDWGPVNQPFGQARFEVLWDRALNHLFQRGDYFTTHMRAGADRQHSIPLLVMTEYAWHGIVAQQLFIRPSDPHDRTGEWLVVNVPSYTTTPKIDGTASDGAVIIDLAKRRILLAGMRYAGEMKKAVFTVMNYLMPESGVLPMHCAANMGADGDVAVFFGLSGTGKTSLSADPKRLLVGDDEHGWNEQGIFNFEGGCYAKCINLSRDKEPVIWDAVRFGAIMENVVLDDSHNPLYGDSSITENTRVSYPREHVERRVAENAGGHPSAVMFLTCDLFGVLPPVSILSREEAAYHFLSGYTALVGGTEVGLFHQVKPTFSACFGAPFFPRRPAEYAKLLMEKLAAHDTPVYLVNTGWTGGGYAKGGRRFDISTTRALVRAILQGQLQNVPTERLPGLNLTIPARAPGVAPGVFNPRETWREKAAYDEAARKLIGLFNENFRRFEVPEAIRKAGPDLAGLT